MIYKNTIVTKGPQNAFDPFKLVSVDDYFNFLHGQSFFCVGLSE